MNTSYKFRIYPNSMQRVLLAQIFGCARFVYNYFLSLRIDNYRFLGKSISYNACAGDLVDLKKLFPFLQSCDSIALQQSLKHLDIAFKNFFERPNAGFPRFKSKRSKASYSTVCVNNNIRFDGKYIILPKLGRVKIKQHRGIPDDYVLKSATVSMTSSGKYYISILFAHENQVPKVVPKAFLGLDYSSPCLYIDSEGREPDFPKFYRRMEDKLAREQRKLSHMRYRSNNWYRQKAKIAKIHEKIANQRKDFLHKLSKQLADTYDVIVIEDLNMQAMSQSLSLGKSTHDNGWGMFVTFLQYKLERQGKQLIRIDKWYPSTKTCHVCGNAKPMKLSDREYVCPECGMVFDRDWNAAINIRDEAIRMLSA